MKSLVKISPEERQAGLGVAASNSFSESLHGASTEALILHGTVRIDHAAGVGQTRCNNDHGRAHQTLVTGRASTKEDAKKSIAKSGAFREGTMIGLCDELRQSLIQASKEQAPAHRKMIAVFIKDQFEM